MAFIEPLLFYSFQPRMRKIQNGFELISGILFERLALFNIKETSRLYDVKEGLYVFKKKKSSLRFTTTRQVWGFQVPLGISSDTTDYSKVFYFV